jgi:hypothetical protein
VAIVVVCVGVLAAIAAVGYIRYRRHARMAEATNLVGVIKTDQEAWKAEKGVFASVSNSSDSFYPAAAPGKFVTAWGGPCTNCVAPNAWAKLGVRPSAPVAYGYATIAGVGVGITPMMTPPTTDPGIMATKSDDDDSAPSGPPNECSSIAPTDPYYLIKAKGDTDGDGVATTVLALSCTNGLIVTNEGE